MARRWRATEVEDDDPREHLRALYRSIYALIRKIPKGHVATYGQVAELAGIPGGARIAAAALKTSKPTDQLPWQRVIGKASKKRGRIAIHDPVGAAIQRGLLEGEGVILGEGDTKSPALPATLLKAQDRDAEIYIVEQDVAQRRKVALGSEQDGYRPITGLKVGTLVIDSGKDLVGEGSRLRVISSSAAAGNANTPATGGK